MSTIRTHPFAHVLPGVPTVLPPTDLITGGKTRDPRQNLELVLPRVSKTDQPRGAWDVRMVRQHRQDQPGRREEC